MKLCEGVALALTVSYGLTYCHTIKSKLTLGQQSDSLTIIHITNPTDYTLLPIEEEASESQVLLRTGETVDTDTDIRLAQNQVDYFVLSALPGGTRNVTVRVRNKPKDALCWREVKLSDTFDTANTEEFCPVYHYTPLYDWMNDADGLVYRNGEYRLYFRYNPYGSKWGNMHWGYSVSKDLIHWEYLEPAITRDTSGHIFSGSSIVDQEDVAGYRAESILAFYTSTNDKNGQIWCLAFSKDNGRTFTEYEKNLTLCSSDGLKDPHDPRVFRYEPEGRWVMIVSVDKKVCFYGSENLKDWNYMSSFGEGYGMQPYQFECSDMVKSSVDGDTNRREWVLIVNINPGYYFGGGITQYFTGDFDGTRSICDNQLNVTRWLGWGKDHYTTVCFSNTGDHVTAMPWMGNWQHCSIVPTKQFRSVNVSSCELGLYIQNGEVCFSATPVLEMKTLRKKKKEIPTFMVANDCHIDSLLTDNDGAYGLALEVATGGAEIMGFSLFNDKGERVDIYLNLPEKRSVMDQIKNGIVDFRKKGALREIEAHDRRKTTSINYIDDFVLATWAPIRKERRYTLDTSVDRCSIEIFLNGGKIAMANLILPSEPYNHMCSYSKGGTLNVDSFNVYRLDS